MLHLIYLGISFASSLMYALARHLFRKISGYFIVAGLTISGYIALFALHVAVFVLVGTTINEKKLPKSIHTFYRWFGLLTLKVFVDSFRFKIKISGKEKLPKENFLIVCNHRSIFDPLIGITRFKKYNMAYISKEENLKIPFVGRYMKAVGCLDLDRENPRNAINTINKAADYIRTGHCNLGIYPEGKENKTDEPLLPFRAGAFKVAKKAKCPVAVMTIKNSDRVFRRFMFKRIKVEMDILGVIEAADVERLSTQEISDIAYDMMRENLAA
ncbi:MULTISPECIES: lysophospholipid acyltransferase family protein [Eubacterium]|uniref:Acyltransferase n=2 Tax=Eubacterium ruminantium TaxID=42322 RepID=A0A1T4L3Q3_9FIRM|nr:MULTISPECIES: lysophospholipid acyltransferase family protein [Eubacterium]MCR5368158.1 1-acyl-sn-glycerol-3-phosphate acyltransferase [Eubacterium sp.]SCW43161.1 Acyltransferase [Eubacterium ruminantium]SDM81121.1 1-acyl-sn-glycerol-3-phosphate acyltransferase [Eubacterium ruminantium]SJZ49346.1 Acyltransferase [Eubacterium ruminantium]